MNQAQLGLLCQRLQLGAPLGEPQRVTGGRLHQLWRIETTQGAFAVKALNPQIIGQPGARDIYHRAEQIAAVMAAQGMPAITALTYRKRPVQTIDRLAVLVFPWIDGTTLPPGPASPEQARQIGALLGKMHSLKLAIPGLEPPVWRVLRDDDWVLLTRRATEQRVSWAEEVRAALRDLRWWSRLARDANARLWNTLVVSHGDLDQKNVLWRDANTPIVIDWESAGLINPTLELASVEIDWSGHTAGNPSEASFAAVLEGYHSAGGTLQASTHDALSGCLGRWLEWLELNMRRSVDGSLTSPEAEDMAWSEVYGTLCVLYRLAEGMEGGVSLLSP